MNLYFSIKFKLDGGHLNDVTEKILNLAREQVSILENFRCSFFPYPAHCPWFSEDSFNVISP